MRLGLDSDSPIPLYHQIAEALRYAIATGEIGEGDRLPPVREAAAAHSVNMHTIRRAYRALSEQGFVEMRGAGGTVVTGRAQPGRRTTHASRPGARVTVLECSDTQATDLAEQLERRFRVVAQP